RIALRPEDPDHPGVRLARPSQGEQVADRASQAPLVVRGAPELLEHARDPRPRVLRETLPRASQRLARQVTGADRLPADLAVALGRHKPNLVELEMLARIDIAVGVEEQRSFAGVALPGRRPDVPALDREEVALPLLVARAARQEVVAPVVGQPVVPSAH